MVSGTCCDSWGCPVKGQELITLKGLIQLQLFYDFMNHATRSRIDQDQDRSNYLNHPRFWPGLELEDFYPAASWLATGPHLHSSHDIPDNIYTKFCHFFLTGMYKFETLTAL